MRTLEPIIISGDQTGTRAFTIGSPEIGHSLGDGSQLGYAGGSDVSGRSPGATIPLVPRRTFFRNPDRTNVQLSSLTSQIPVDKWHAFIGEPKIS